MKRVKIELKRADIYKQVRMETEYVGAKSPDDADLYQRIVLQEENYDILDSWWEDGIYGIVNAMSHYICDEEPTEPETTADDDINFVLGMPDNWGGKGNLLNKLSASYVVNYLAAKWMSRAKMMEEVQNYTLETAVAMGNVKKELKLRKRPGM